jgi:hypothetical protein
MGYRASLFLPLAGLVLLIMVNRQRHRPPVCRRDRPAMAVPGRHHERPLAVGAHVADPPSGGQRTPRYPDCRTLITKRNGASLQGTHGNPGTDDGVESVLVGLDFRAVCPRPRCRQCRRLGSGWEPSGRSSGRCPSASAWKRWYDASAETRCQPAEVSLTNATPLGCERVHAASIPSTARIGAELLSTYTPSATQTFYLRAQSSRRPARQ